MTINSTVKQCRTSPRSALLIGFCLITVFMPLSVRAQLLLESDYGSGNIYSFTPAGAQTTLATGLVHPLGLAFGAQTQSLFLATQGCGDIYKITGGSQTVFASGLSTPEGLAFNSAGDLFVADAGSGSIYEYDQNGTRSTLHQG